MHSEPYLDRFWNRIDASGDCWEWIGKRYPNGYGRHYIPAALGGGEALPHRYIWQLLVGPIPRGYEMDHLCRNRACVNPDHLEPVTRRENMMRGYGPFVDRAKQTHCVRGHPLSGDNLTHSSAGTRQCMTCRRMHAANYWGTHKK